MNRILKTFIFLSIPNIISNLIVPFASTIDLAVLGQDSALLPVSAVVMGTIIFEFLFIGFNFLRMGTTSIVARTLDEDQHQVILLRSLAIAFSCGILIILFSPLIKIISEVLISGNLELKDEMFHYFDGRILGAPAVLMNLVFLGWYLGKQKVKHCLNITLFSNGLNIILTIYLVLVLKKGSWGAGLSTSLANSFVCIIYILINLKQFANISKVNIKEAFDKDEILLLFKMNLNLFIRTIMIVSVFSMFTSLSSSLGSVVLVSNSLLLKLLSFFSYFIDGFAFSIETMGGKFYVQKEFKKLKQILSYSFVLSLICFFLFISGFYLFWEEGISLLNKNLEVIQYSMKDRVILIIIMFVAQGAYIYDGLYIGIGDFKNMRNSNMLGFILALLCFLYFIFVNKINMALWIGLLLFMLTRFIYLSCKLKSNISSNE
ncbi:MAG: MATE family multidrug resistance protein [Thermoproteota archaeon]|jgi:MATE family multidrug resistance protein